MAFVARTKKRRELLARDARMSELQSDVILQSYHVIVLIGVLGRSGIHLSFSIVMDDDNTPLAHRLGC